VVLLALSALVTSVEQLLVLRVGTGLFGGIDQTRSERVSTGRPVTCSGDM